MRKTVAPITDRQKTILALIVREYTETTRPVGSKRLIDRYSLSVSSATVRNEMAADRLRLSPSDLHFCWPDPDGNRLSLLRPSIAR